MIKLKERSVRPVQISDCISVLAIFIGVFLIKPELRSIPYDVYSLIVLLLRVMIPAFKSKLKFRYYMAIRYLFLAIFIGFASILFSALTETHPSLYFLVLGTTLVQEILTTVFFQRLPTIKE